MSLYDEGGNCNRKVVGDQEPQCIDVGRQKVQETNEEKHLPLTISYDYAESSFCEHEIAILRQTVEKREI